MNQATIRQPAKTARQKAAGILAWTFVGLGFFTAGYGLIVAAKTPDGFTLANLSSFGSYAQGTVAALWSLGALFFIYATLLAQEKQIHQQEHQLEQQRLQFAAEQQRQQLESEHQEKQFQLQQQAIRRQSFENSLFQLLGLFTEVRQEVTLKHHESGKETVYEGLRCFSACKKLLKATYHGTSDPTGPAAETEPAAQACFLQFHTAHREGLDQYFRVLYHTIKFIHASPALTADEERRHYTSLVRAQLTDNELLLLFYNGICPHAEKFRPLIEKYGLLEHLNHQLLLHPAHAKFYDQAYE